MASRHSKQKSHSKTGRSKKMKLSDLGVPKGGAVKGGTTMGATKWGDITLKK